MIDLHLHLLPGIDDGADSLDVSRAMLEQARSVGYRTLVATPHLHGPLSPAMWERVNELLTQVRHVAAPLGIDVRLGFELMLTPDLPERLVGGEPVTLSGSRSLLVELPFSAWPQHTEQTLFALQVAGYRPLLAHPERYRAVQQDPNRALMAAERGIVLQVTIGSLSGLFGRTVRHTAEHLVRSADAVVVATDAHSVGKRTAVVAEGLDRLRELVGEASAHELVEDAPRALLTDAPLLTRTPPAPASSTAKWGNRWRRRLVRGHRA